MRLKWIERLLAEHVPMKVADADRESHEYRCQIAKANGV